MTPLTKYFCRNGQRHMIYTLYYTPEAPKVQCGPGRFRKATGREPGKTCADPGPAARETPF